MTSFIISKLLLAKNITRDFLLRYLEPHRFYNWHFRVTRYTLTWHEIHPNASHPNANSVAGSYV